MNSGPFPLEVEGFSLCNPSQNSTIIVSTAHAQRLSARAGNASCVCRVSLDKHRVLSNNIQKLPHCTLYLSEGRLLFSDLLVGVKESSAILRRDKIMDCLITLPNSVVHRVSVAEDATGQECLDKVRLTVALTLYYAA